MTDDLRDQFERLVGELRPKLHRYCARMTGSAVDGEDVVQEALIKALAAHTALAPIDNVEGWLFATAHNPSLDFLRARARHTMVPFNDEAAFAANEPDPDIAS